MSAAFSFRSFARRGADRSLAGWVLTISGLISAITFALIVAGGAILTGNAVAAVVGALAASATVVPVLLCLIALRNDRLRASAGVGRRTGASGWLNASCTDPKVTPRS